MARFQPGQSGNPEGRPKRDWTIAGLIEEALEQQNQFGVPWKKVMVYKLVSLAGSGDMVAIKEINQRLDGMPKQDVDVGGDIQITVIDGEATND